MLISIHLKRFLNACSTYAIKTSVFFFHLFSFDFLPFPFMQASWASSELPQFTKAVFFKQTIIGSFTSNASLWVGLIHKQLRCLCRTIGPTFGKNKVRTDTIVPPAELFSNGIKMTNVMFHLVTRNVLPSEKWARCILGCIICFPLKCQRLPVIGDGMSGWWGCCSEVTQRIMFLSSLCDLVCLGTIQ